MARAETTDFMQNFRFFVSALDGANPLAFSTGSGDTVSQAGFQSATLPEYSVDASEYREGTYLYTRKFPGIPTVSDLSLVRGVARRHASFTDWVLTAVKGGEYRTDLVVHHYHRTDAENHVKGSTGTRQTVCYNCFPIRAKSASDLDATAGDVSLAEVDISVEYFEVKDGNSVNLHGDAKYLA